MRVVSVINYKGGVGKTTVTANLGAQLASKGYRILLIDMDPQASLTFSFIRPEDWEKDLAQSKTLKSWLKKAFGSDPLLLKEFCHRQGKTATMIDEPGILDLIPSHRDLINIDLDLATHLSGRNLEQAKRRFVKT